MKKSILSFLSAAILAVFTLSSSHAAHHEGGHDELAPDTVIHVVTVSWKEEATPEQIQAALDAVKVLGAEYEGISRVWIRTIKAQGDRSHAFVMEFTSEQALKDYAGSDAQKKWYETYYIARERSTTFDISN
ncbi:Dabb family protein [Puniceicoccaceae bacterium K14]|nr:Dabb family protein [Puniceicoccaceae bacterium K14]